MKNHKTFMSYLEKLGKIFICFILMFSVSSCNCFSNANIEEESEDGYLKCTLTEFKGEHKVKLLRTTSGEGRLSVSASLVSGDIEIYYDMGNVNYTSLIMSLKEGEEKEVKDGYFEGKEIIITFKSDMPATGVFVFTCEN